MRSAGRVPWPPADGGMPTGRPGPLVPAGPLRDLLTAQRTRGGLHGYRLGSYVPPLPEIHIEQRVGSGTATVRDALEHERHLFLVAGPGGGKSATVSMLAAESATHWLEARRGWHGLRARRKAPFGGAVAVVLPATAAADPVARDLPEALAFAHLPPDGTPGDLAELRALFARRPLRGVPWLVMIDGVDEVAGAAARRLLAGRIEGVLRAGGRVHRIMVTGRPLPDGRAVDLAAPEVRTLRLRPFGPAELRRFADAWFAARLDIPEAAGRAAAGLADAVQRVRQEVLPLVAVVAALLYEIESEPRAVLDRSALFRTLVSVLRTGRRSAPPQLTSQVDVPEWLTGQTEDLVGVLAAAQVSESRAGVMDVARVWAAETAPDEPEPSTATLHALLTGASLFDVAEGEPVFLDRGIAEYLAAGSREFDEDRWRAEMREPSRRSLALFTLARRGPSAEEVVDRLLSGPDPDPVTAAHVVADGAARERWDRVVGVLAERVAAGQVECLPPLLALAPAADVHARLAALVQEALASAPPHPAALRLARRLLTDASVAVPVRLAAAEALLGSEGVPVREVLCDLAWNPDVPDTDRRRALDLLAGAPDGLARLLDAAADTDPSLRVQAQGALGLAETAALRNVATAAPRLDHRLPAARALLWRGEPDGAEILAGIALDGTVDARHRAEAARALLSDARAVEPALLARLVTCTGLSRAQRAIALELLDARGTALTALCAIATDHNVTPPLRTAAAVRLLKDDRVERVPPSVLEALATDTGIDAWLRHGAVRRLGAGVHVRLALDEATDPQTRVWTLPEAFEAAPKARRRLEQIALKLAFIPELAPESRLQALTMLSAPPSLRLLLKVAEIAERSPGTVPDEFADHAAGQVAEMLEQASDDSARTLLLAPRVAERIRAVALERLLRRFPRPVADLVRDVVLGADTPPELRRLAAETALGRPATEPLLALVASGRLDRGTWLPAALREPGAGTALAWELVRDPRTVGRSAVITALCESELA
ncbi:hypothetical protein [Actinomadura opuntiae]|uniref:hypothetical protein n=1 Tax=Actinomadura sp. OS1-43 TaxID=604315 RepID=UPI00255B32EC|nr:hypothetical protein [Actinomadura sp. OS1-43]MDL4815120.1 hypothetical protein [Actinomadura sp. OS1-43]